MNPTCHRFYPQGLPVLPTPQVETGGGHCLIACFPNNNICLVTETLKQKAQKLKEGELKAQRAQREPSGVGEDPGGTLKENGGGFLPWGEHTLGNLRLVCDSLGKGTSKSRGGEGRQWQGEAGGRQGEVGGEGSAEASKNFSSSLMLHLMPSLACLGLGSSARLPCLCVAVCVCDNCLLPIPIIIPHVCIISTYHG